MPKYEYANLGRVEQETIINAVRIDNGILLCYSSDRRVIPKILKYYPKNIEKIHYNQEKKVTAISLQVTTKEFRKSIFFPHYKGEQTPESIIQAKVVQNE